MSLHIWCKSLEMEKNTTNTTSRNQQGLAEIFHETLTSYPNPSSTLLSISHSISANRQLLVLWLREVGIYFMNVTSNNTSISLSYWFKYFLSTLRRGAWHNSQVTYQILLVPFILRHLSLHFITRCWVPRRYLWSVISSNTRFPQVANNEICWVILSCLISCRNCFRRVFSALFFLSWKIIFQMREYNIDHLKLF